MSLFLYRNAQWCDQELGCTVAPEAVGDFVAAFGWSQVNWEMGQQKTDLMWEVGDFWSEIFNEICSNGLYLVRIVQCALRFPKSWRTKFLTDYFSLGCNGRVEPALKTCFWAVCSFSTYGRALKCRDSCAWHGCETLCTWGNTKCQIQPSFYNWL